MAAVNARKLSLQLLLVSLARPSSAGFESSEDHRSIESRLAALEAKDACATNYPEFDAEKPPSSAVSFYFRGRNRNVHRNSTRSTDLVKNGTLSIYNASTVAYTGFFDAKLSSGVDAWHFVCALAPDAPHTATCTLTFETPLRPEGPAWLQIRFHVLLRDNRCVATAATLTGTYFYDALTNDAGVYVFRTSNVTTALKGTALGQQQQPLTARAAAVRRTRLGDVASERASLTALASSCGIDGWTRKRHWLSDAHSICDWELVGCDAEGRVKLLTLDFNNLTGTLPTSLGLGLPRLQDLDLEHNALVGTLPSTLGGLGSLVQLGLGGNRLSGPLPAQLCPALERIVGAGPRARAADARSSSPPPCDLSGNAFECPLPCGGAVAACGGACGGNLTSAWRTINAVTLFTADLRSSQTFYEALGLYTTWQSPRFVTLSSQNLTDSHTIMHVNLNLSRGYAPPRGGWGRFIVYVADVDATYRRARRRGLTPEGAPADMPWGERSFALHDPSGHEVVIATPMADLL